MMLATKVPPREVQSPGADTRRVILMHEQPTRRAPDGPQVPGLLCLYDTQGACDLVRVDFDDWEQFRSHRLFRLGSLGYAGIKANGEMAYLHRLILGVAKGEQIDHINRDVLDNRRINLRVATASENQGNRAINERCWGRWRHERPDLAIGQVWAVNEKAAVAAGERQHRVIVALDESFVWFETRGGRYATAKVRRHVNGGIVGHRFVSLEAMT